MGVANSHGPASFEWHQALAPILMSNCAASESSPHSVPR